MRTASAQAIYLGMRDNGSMSVPKPGKKDVRVLKGIIRSPNRRAVTVEEMNQAIAAGAAKASPKPR